MPSYIVKADPDEDWYCYWSTVVDAPVAFGTRAELEAAPWMTPAEVAPDRFARADETGSSANWANWPADQQPYIWSDTEGFVLMDCGPDRDPDEGIWVLPRANLREFCERGAGPDTADLCRFEPYVEEADA